MDLPRNRLLSVGNIGNLCCEEIIYILVSKSFSSRVSNPTISHYGNNLSDHSPVEMLIRVNCRTLSKTPRTYSSYIPWNSLNENEVQCYEKTMETLLNEIDIPRAVSHGSTACCISEHCFALEAYFRDIINAIVQADLT